MKRKFSKILGVGLTLSLLTSLLLTAAPVSALTQPSVTLDDDEISATNVEYSIIFAITEDLDQGEDIIIEFPDGTDITAVGTTDVLIGATSGIGSGAFSGAVPTAVSDDGQELTITLATPVIGTETKIGVGATVQVLVDDVDNPDEPGDDYTLDVSTSDEAAVTSGPYEIVVPDIGGLPGIVSLYNPTGILMAQYTGNDGIQDAIDAADEDYIVKIGPGTYVYDILVDVEGLTLEATGAAKDTIIQNDTTYLEVASGYDEVTIEGLTFQGEMVIYADGVTIEDCIFEKLDDGSSEVLLEYDGSDTIGGTIANCTFDTTEGSEDDIGLYIDDDGLTVSECSFVVDEDDWGIELYYDATVKDCEFTGSSGIGIYFEDEIGIITGNTFDGLENAIYIYWASDGSKITGNTIMKSTGDAIYVEDTDEVVITNNTITDTDEDYYALYVEDDADYVFFLFNSVTGNEGNVYSEDTSYEVNATHNWWGDADGPAADSIAGDGDVDTSAYLGAPVTSAVVVLDEDDLDAKTAAGVKVSGATGASIIGAAAYSDNPQEAIADALAFYDVYVAGATDDPTIKFYAGDENSKLYAWSADTDIWVEQDADFSAFGGYVYATVDADLLEGTPHVLVAGEATPATLAAPDIAAPVSGDDTISLTPTFAWSAVADADGYYFELADNANFVLPLVKLDGDTGRLIVTAYAYVGELPYSTAYYWKVKAVSGTVEFGDLLESDWVSAVFITKAEPVEPVPPVVVQEAPVLPDITITQPDIIIESPDIIVPLPAETPITPGWIYAIIAVGALLVIALLVLIVRTRRVA